MKELETFAQPRLIGDRFEGGVIPVEALAELAAYRDLVLEVAKALFRQAHGRARVRQGFTAEFAIALRHIGDGSAHTELVRPAPLMLRQLVGPDEFERARDLVAETVASVGAGRGVPPEFPPALLGRFNLFGRRLGPGEAIELIGPGASEGPRYTPEVRKKLVFQGSGETVEEAVDLLGEAIAIDVQKRTFTVSQEDGTPLVVPLADDDEELVLDAIGRRTEVQLRVVGIGERDRRDRLVRVSEVDSVELVPVADPDRTPIAVQLRTLRDLEPGWIDGEGEVPEPEGLRWLEALLLRLTAEGLPTPRLYPTLEGGVHAEWAIRGWEISATFDLDTKRATLLAASPSDPSEDVEDELDLAAAEGPAKLAAWVVGFEEREG